LSESEQRHAQVSQKFQEKADHAERLEAESQASRDETDTLKQRLAALETALWQAQEELATSASGRKSTVEGMEKVQKELAKEATPRSERDRALSESEQRHAQVSQKFQEKADHAERLEAESQASRDETDTLKQRLAALETALWQAQEELTTSA